MPSDNKYNELAHCPDSKQNLDSVGVEVRPEAPMNAAVEGVLINTEKQYSTEFMSFGEWNEFDHAGYHHCGEI